MSENKSNILCGLPKCAKRVSFWLSVHTKGSVTVEASIVLPLIIFCFLEMMSLLQGLTVYSGVMVAIKNIGTPISVYGYAYDTLMQQDHSLTIGQKAVSSFVFSELYLDRQMQENVNGKLYKQYLDGGLDGISLLGSYVDRECVSILAHYKVEPIFSVTGRSLRLSNQFYTKMWTGYSVQSNNKEGYVYITEYGSVYHLTTDCTHLKLSVRSVPQELVAKERNDYGERYESCEKCYTGVLQKSYYITEKGDKYHELLTCSGLKRTVTCVPEKVVKDWKMCEKCKLNSR